ncbi:MAG: tRNA pseudouridine(38-40) synthase TruA [Verrucomicrobiota bacterium]
MPQNYKLTIAYHGAAYRGWQRQPDQVSVQETIERALTKLWGGTERIIIHSAGRTDTGVHALGQVAHFTAPAKFKKHGILRNALNANLPDDIRIVQAVSVTSGFHSRFSATGKTYHYRLFCREVHDPMELGRSWQMRRTPDMEKMQQAARHFCGKHNFASFASNPGYERETTVRTIHEIKFVKKGPLITLKFHGDGFLYRMVRNLTGAIVRAGDGRLTPEEIKRILSARNRSSAPPPAPAHGLYLVKVFY